MFYPFCFPVSRTRRILWLSLGFCILFGVGVDAAQVLQGLDSKKVVITLEASFLDEVPERGTLPLHFQIQNKTDKPGRWTFRFSGIQGWNNGKQLSSERVVEVDARSSKNVRWEIPVFPNSEFFNGQNVNLEVTVAGPGTSSYQQSLLNGNSRYSGNVTPMVAVSPELRITRDHWNYSELENELGNRNSSIHLLGFNPAVLPDNVSGYSCSPISMLGIWIGFSSRIMNGDPFWPSS